MSIYFLLYYSLRSLVMIQILTISNDLQVSLQSSIEKNQNIYTSIEKASGASSISDTVSKCELLWPVKLATALRGPPIKWTYSLPIYSERIIYSEIIKLYTCVGLPILLTSGNTLYPISFLGGFFPFSLSLSLYYDVNRIVRAKAVTSIPIFLGH